MKITNNLQLQEYFKSRIEDLQLTFLQERAIYTLKEYFDFKLRLIQGDTIEVEDKDI